MEHIHANTDPTDFAQAGAASDGLPGGPTSPREKTPETMLCGRQTVANDADGRSSARVDDGLRFPSSQRSGRHFSVSNELLYPDEAKAPSGDYWWNLQTWPDQPTRRFGSERRLAAWMRFHVGLGGEFTLGEARIALGDGVVRNASEHFNRRLRKLREDGWVLDTTKDDGSVPIGHYRVKALGWDPSQGRRSSKTKVSDGVRRRVFDRDGRRCVICGIGSREPYSDGTGRVARITVGHRVPNNRRGSAEDLDNLQTECTRCNESVRDQIRDPEALSNVLPDLRKLKRADAKRLSAWLAVGYRQRDDIDRLFDRYRDLSESERADFGNVLQKKVLGS